MKKTNNVLHDFEGIVNDVLEAAESELSLSEKLFFMAQLEATGRDYLDKVAQESQKRKAAVEFIRQQMQDGINARELTPKDTTCKL